MADYNNKYPIKNGRTGKSYLLEPIKMNFYDSEFKFHSSIKLESKEVFSFLT